MIAETRQRVHDVLLEVQELLRGKEDPTGLYERVTNAVYEVRAYRPQMTLNEYQLRASATAIYPGRGSFLGLMYVTGKMAGEAGEFSENTFKALRDDNIATVKGWEAEPIEDGATDDGYKKYKPGEKVITVSFGPLRPERRAKNKKELGDILWYVSQSAFELGYTLGEIAEDNIGKLSDRAERDVLKGSGSDR